MKLSPKDKSLLLFVAATLVVLWGLYSFFSSIFFATTFRNSDVKKIVSHEKIQWLNVSRPLEIADLKERIILLEFWSYGCVSCIEALPEVKRLEEQFGSKLLVIGVHSGKLENEKDVAAIKKAILKNDITYPVVNDPEMQIWNSFSVKAWPTFILINPRSNVVESYVGAKSLEKVKIDLKEIISKYKYQVNRDPLPTLLEKYNLIGNVLSFPTKLEYANDFSYKSRHLPVIFIANSGKNNIVVSSLAGDIVTKIGSPKEGLQDGSFDVASFNAPHGMLYQGGKLYVADTGNHALREIDFKTGRVSTLIGSGQQGEVVESNGEFLDAKDLDLSLPTDIEFFPDRNNIVIANSGTHQILSYNIAKQTVSILAGDGSQGIADGKYPENSLSQTTDMSAFGRKLYFVDAESSSLRVLDESGNLKTLIGHDSSKSGHKNGDKNNGLMQHPMGLMVDDTGAYISDSFNHAIRKYDFASGQISDFVGGKKRGDGLGSSANTQFDEPEGIIAVLDRFYVADTNNNRIVSVGRGTLNSELLDVMPPLQLPKEGFLQYLPNLQAMENITVKADSEIIIKIDLKKGWRLNEMGPSFVNLLEMVKDKQANLVDSFDWHIVKTKEIKLPKLSSGKDYMLQGSIYYCEEKRNALCYIKSYEQRVNADADEKAVVIDLKLGY